MSSELQARHEEALSVYRADPSDRNRLAYRQAVDALAAQVKADRGREGRSRLAIVVGRKLDDGH